MCDSANCSYKCNYVMTTFLSSHSYSPSFLPSFPLLLRSLPTCKSVFAYTANSETAKACRGKEAIETVLHVLTRKISRDNTHSANFFFQQFFPVLCVIPCHDYTKYRARKKNFKSKKKSFYQLKWICIELKNVIRSSLHAGRCFHQWNPTLKDAGLVCDEHGLCPPAGDLLL